MVDFNYFFNLLFSIDEMAWFIILFGLSVIKPIYWSSLDLSSWEVTRKIKRQLPDLFKWEDTYVSGTKRKPNEMVQDRASTMPYITIL